MLDQPFEEEPLDTTEMSFLDHIEVLRWHIIRSLIAIAIGTILAFIGRKIVVAILMGPSQLSFWTYRKLCELSQAVGTDALCIESLNFELINRKMFGQFTQHLTVSIVAGVILAFPYLLFEVWRFIKPALKPSERRYLQGIIFSGSLLFFAGVLVGYYMLAPISVQFLANYTFIEELQNKIDLESYISIVTMVTLAASLVFELPIVVYFLAKAGLITAGTMRTYRKHALLVILIVSAIITPPDVLSQIMLSIPFFILYESSILIAARIERKQLKAEANERIQ
ncbi:twin-arginine translocase subunit TatC [bacterium]|nr:twin-arginine translocase subunit TatC [bacterium]